MMWLSEPVTENKHFGNNFMEPGGGCLMKRQYVVKINGNVSDWLSSQVELF